MENKVIMIKEVKDEVVEDMDNGEFWHTCPYAEEIGGDYETLCNCDDEATYQCAMDI